MTDELEQARKIIDKADQGIAELFSQRMQAVKQVAAYKAQRGLPITDTQREQELIEAHACLVDEEIRSYYLLFLEHTFEISKQYQQHIIEATPAGEGLAH